MIKAFIFDFDGVIIDTNNYHFLSWKKSLDDFGIDFSSEDYKKIKGLSRSYSVDYISLFNKKIEHNKVELLKRKNDIYLELIEDLNSDDLMLGVKDFLINNKKFKLGVASSSRNARYILKKIKCDHFFDIIIDANDVCESKPNPNVFLKCADALGFQPYECIVFEDSENGLLAAKRGGFNTYLVGNDKIKHLADNYINDLTSYK